jgi:hypothetical protein
MKRTGTSLRGVLNSDLPGDVLNNTVLNSDVPGSVLDSGALNSDVLNADLL